MEKTKVKEALVQNLQDRLQAIQTQLDALKSDMNAEAKSTSGDKHETGRAMIQLEMENMGKQHQNWESFYLIAKGLDTEAHHVAKAGSLLKMNDLWHYLSVGIGKIQCDGEDIFCLAPSAPLAQMILGISAGSKITFNQRTLEIQEIY